MQFDRGYISIHIVTDYNKMEAVFENPYIEYRQNRDLYFRMQE